MKLMAGISCSTVSILGQGKDCGTKASGQGNPSNPKSPLSVMASLPLAWNRVMDRVKPQF